MVLDSFIFFNELDLLEIRLNILDKHVDRFVLVEATQTFSGLTKPLFYLENKERFAKWNHKILHYVVDDYPNNSELRELADSSPNVPKGETHWHREFYQKESIRLALKDCNDEDIVFVSDLDEIWNPLNTYSPGEISKLKQLGYVYYLNNRSSEPWAGTYVGLWKDLKTQCFNHLRSGTPLPKIENGGWHFTNMGGADQIRKKLESYGHQEFNTSFIKNLVDTQIRNNKDFIGRDFAFWVDESDLPQYLKDNKESWIKLFRS